jgi:phage terminase large subunit-like protein
MTTLKPFTVAHIRAWARRLILDSGQPWVIEPFQARFFADLFSPEFLEHWLVIPEGNAKTTLAGGTALYYAEFQEFARIPVAAASRDQAEWLYQAAAGFVERSELRQFKCQEGYRRIKCETSGGRIQIFAADDRTGDGIIPGGLCLLEELHRQRDLNLYRTWRGKLEKRGAKLMAISTAGEPDGEFELTRKRMRDEATHVTRKGSFTRAISGNAVIHEYAVPEEGNPENLRQVKAANPLKAITIASLKRKKSSPAMTPAHWLRFACGMAARLDSWLTPAEWDRLKVDVGEVVPGDEVYVGVRIGAEIGIGLASIRGEGVAVKMIPMLAPVASRVPLKAVEAKLREVAAEYDVIEVQYDRDPFQRSAEILAEEGLPMEHEFQSVKRLTQATSTLWRLVSGGLLSHDGDPELRRQVLAARTKETQQGWRIDPTADTNGLIAVMLASHAATDVPPANLDMILPSVMA